jgi:hypothetical protein
MRTTFFAAVAVSGRTTFAYTLTAKAPAPASQGRVTQQANPTGLPACMTRPDGLMTNRLLPSNGWQG